MTDNRCPPWRNPRVVLVLSLVFLCGVLVGGLAMRQGMHRWIHNSGVGLSNGDKEMALARLTKELDLDADQQKRLEVILDDFVKYVQTLQAQMDEVRANGKDRILLILSEEQKKKFEKMLDGLDVRRNRDK